MFSKIIFQGPALGIVVGLPTTSDPMVPIVMYLTKVFLLGGGAFDPPNKFRLQNEVLLKIPTPVFLVLCYF